MDPENKPELDLAELRELYGDELLLALLREFRNSAPEMLAAVQAAVEGADAEALFQSSHRLKSAVSNLYSDGASEAAAQLEHMGRFDQLDAANGALEGLQTKLSRLLAAVDEAIAAEPGEDSTPVK